MILKNSTIKQSQSSQDILEKIEHILEKKFAAHNTPIDTSVYARGVDLMLKKPDSPQTKQYISLCLVDLGKDFYNLLPESTKNRREVQLEALRLGIIKFSDIPKKLTAEKEFVDTYIWTLRQNLSIPYLLAVLFSDSSLKSHKNIFRQYFYDSENLMRFSQLEQLYIQLYFEHPKTLKILWEKSMFSHSSISFWLHPEFEKYLFWDIDVLSSEEIWEKISEKIVSYIWISEKKLPENLISIFLAYIMPKLKTKKKNNKQNTKEEEDQDDITENFLDEISQDEAFYSQWVRKRGSYVYYESPYYPNTQLEITSEEYKSANETSLENFIKFSQLLQRLDLNFLLKAKHRNKIQIATGINFFADTGMSDARVFLFLCKLGRHIWVPESNYEDEHGNKKISEFQTLWEAIFVFTNIRSSGFIAGEKICDVGKKWDNSIVELALKFKGKIGGSYDEILLSNWK